MKAVEFQTWILHPARAQGCFPRMFVGLAKKLALFCAGSVCGRDRRDEIARIRGPIMFKNLTVQHVTFVSKRPFSEVVKAFVHNVGRLEEAGWSSIPASSKDAAEFEDRVKQTLGPSGFTRFLTIDHGEWLRIQGIEAKFMLYIIGNPLIAITMLRHNIEAGLDVPVRLAIFEDERGDTKLVYNTPSSLMGGLGNAELTTAARQLDAKLLALGEMVTGVKA